MHLIRYLFFLSVFLCFKQRIIGQSILSSILNTSGGSFVVPGSAPKYANYNFEWSIGEATIITTNYAPGLQVTHGVLQGFLQVPAIVSSNGTWFPDELKFYPNPVLTDFTVELLTKVKGVVSFIILDYKGRVLYTRNINYYGLGATERFSVDFLPSENYLLRVVINAFPSAGGYLLKEGTFKFIKVR